jgi:hypothetical protein
MHHSLKKIGNEPPLSLSTFINKVVAKMLTGPIPVNYLKQFKKKQVSVAL